MCDGTARAEVPLAPLITIFAIPKPFRGHSAVIQRNAIRSWRRLVPACRVILCGDEDGTAATAREFEATHLPEIARNAYGTPLLDAAFDAVRRTAATDVLCYVNCDILLLSDLTAPLRSLAFDRFLLAGRRWNLDVAAPLHFDQPDWESHFRRHLARHGTLHTRPGIDCFLFRSDDPLGDLPPFAVGRPGWDQWLVYRARRLGLPVVDITRSVTIVHQNHGYGHVPGGTGERWEGPEAARNRALMGGYRHGYDLLDATHILAAGAVVPAIGPRYLLRRWLIRPLLTPAAYALKDALGGRASRR